MEGGRGRGEEEMMGDDRIRCRKMGTRLEDQRMAKWRDRDRERGVKRNVRDEECSRERVVER